MRQQLSSDLSQAQEVLESTKRLCSVQARQLSSLQADNARLSREAEEHRANDGDLVREAIAS